MPAFYYCFWNLDDNSLDIHAIRYRSGSVVGKISSKLSKVSVDLFDFICANLPVKINWSPLR